MIALDLDGTLLDFAPEGPTPRINHALIASLAAQGVEQAVIYTNQGGLCFGVLNRKRKENEKPYPKPEQFLLRLDAACTALARAGIEVIDVRVSCWHKAARKQDDVAAAVRRAAKEVREGLHARHFPTWCVYTTAAARKPSPLILLAIGATCYYGDSPEDAEAAQNAGIEFVKVERFL